MIGTAAARTAAGRPRALVVAPIALGVAFLLAGAVAWSTGRAVDLPGTPLDARPSPDFRLTDYRGVELQLSSLRGRPVVLVFLYTSCADVCLLTTAGLAETAREVPEAAFVAISVDPTGDDPSTVRRFLARQGVGDRLTYLTGPSAALERTWGEYFVHADAAMHTDAIYLIDREGRQRALLRSDFDPGELTAALRSLL